MLSLISIVIFWTVQASALLVFVVPFSWGLVALWAASHFLRAVGLTLAYHRYYAHRAFQMNRVARFVWTFIGAAAMQKGPLWWAGHHVYHHKFADRDGDPHSPRVSGFYYAHIGWFLHDKKYKKIDDTNPVVRDFSKFPEIRFLDEYLLPAAAGARDCDVRDRRLPVARVGLLSADDDAGACHVRDQYDQSPVWIAPVRNRRRVAQQPADGVLRGR